MIAENIVPASLQEIRVISSIISYQYGIDYNKIHNILRNLDIRIQRSTSTERIRHVYIGDQLAFTLRATDGHIVFTVQGALKLHSLLADKYYVAVTDDAADYIAKGRTVFSKHVIEADPQILPGDEVFVKNRDRIIAVGKALLPGTEMGVTKRGKAVKTRRGIKEKH